MKYIIHERVDGGISISPIPDDFNGDPLEHRSTREMRAHNIKFFRCSVVNTIPTSRLFRNAWRVKGGVVQPDMVVARHPKIMKIARNAKMEAIRAERNARLAETDDAFMAAHGKARADLESLRQALRDLPASIDLQAVETPEELEAFKPAWPGE